MVAEITLDPATGPVGTEVEITGSGFAADDAITFTFGGSPIVPTDAPIVSDMMGDFVAHIIVPAATVGAKAIVATDEAAGTDDANFTVESQITLSVATGEYGDSVTVTGSGFAGNSATTIEANSVDVTGAVLTTNATGGFSRAITIPDMPNGNNNIVAEDAGMNSDTAVFDMNASIEINPTEAEAGSDIAIIAHGFTAADDLTVKLATGTVVTTPATLTVDAAGTISGTFLVPITQVVAENVTVTVTDESMVSATTQIDIIESDQDPIYHGAGASRKLASALLTSPIISVDQASMAALYVFDNRNATKTIVQIQNIDDTNEADFNLYGSLSPSDTAPVWAEATWTKIESSDLAIDKQVTKSIITEHNYNYLAVTGKKHSGDDESQVKIFVRQIINSPNS